MHIFVDANVLLGFYALSPSELEEVRKLVALVKTKKITLWMPEQAADEFRRNRPKVVAEARKTLADTRIRHSLPAIASSLPETAVAEAALKAAHKAHSELMDALDVKIASRSLEADIVLEELLALADTRETDSLLPAARDRRDLRRPPGKATSLGDALNWEALLRDIPQNEDVLIVTDDGDFRSPLNEYRLHEYLADEWSTKKSSTATLYRNLGALAKDHYPNIKLATDVEKLSAIQALESSSTFAETHSVVARLSRFDLFSPEQARALIKAAALNSQVRWIARDEDVFGLLTRVIDAHREALEPWLVTMLESEMHPTEPKVSSGDVDLPF